jgi:hypothetical protein
MVLHHTAGKTKIMTKKIVEGLWTSVKAVVGMPNGSKLNALYNKKYNS